jgi:hypothetical protein
MILQTVAKQVRVAIFCGAPADVQRDVNDWLSKNLVMVAGIEQVRYEHYSADAGITMTIFYDPADVSDLL